ncbi:hypothetical protein K0M31_020521 [Melipona bicolor]|uniref:HTH CENPB-type domain-containing protein n=1 Tax=Melipona bicolor TaxID=60889 RepID=A0AA40KDS4_9HYME|nr:hypothetical protein K0M31_020521 [Melipona bicolor]
MAENLFPTATTRRRLTLAERLAILHKLDTGENIKSLALKYNVTIQTIKRIQNNGPIIRQRTKERSRLDRKVIRPSAFTDLKEKLYSWVLQRRLEGELITDNILTEKAEAMRNESGRKFKNWSQNWLWRYKSTYDLWHVSSFSVNKIHSRQFILKLSETQKEFKISDDNLYNMDETSLFWRMLPKEVTGASEQGVIKNERITLALCSNATGSHKLPLLLINKHGKPRALKHCMNSLPVIYTHNQNAWMNTEIFRFWYHSTFKPCVRRQQLSENNNGKILLIVDNFRAHNLSEEEMDDGHFKIMFLPPNTSSLIQPMDRGVITKFKRRFRHRLLQCFFQHENGPSEFYADYDIKNCIALINEAWNSILPSNIFDSWSKILGRKTNWLGDFASEIVSCDVQYGTIFGAKLTGWINQCEEAEKIEEGAEESSYLLSPSPIEAKEIDRLRYNLRYIL